MSESKWMAALGFMFLALASILLILSSCEKAENTVTVEYVPDE